MNLHGGSWCVLFVCLFVSVRLCLSVWKLPENYFYFWCLLIHRSDEASAMTTWIFQQTVGNFLNMSLSGRPAFMKYNSVFVPSWEEVSQWKSLWELQWWKSFKKVFYYSKMYLMSSAKRRFPNDVTDFVQNTLCV